ncbi:MAG: hypothetical protein K0U72_05640 [Gammaproteobacteria bacterium]|nr:hypothetical protein [Gammaproteobacteria bacterium]
MAQEYATLPRNVSIAQWAKDHWGKDPSTCYKWFNSSDPPPTVVVNNRRFIPVASPEYAEWYARRMKAQRVVNPKSS